jgi:hypothetical protein
MDSTFAYHNIILVSRNGGGIEPTPPWITQQRARVRFVVIRRITTTTAYSSRVFWTLGILPKTMKAMSSAEVEKNRGRNHHS